MISYRSADRPLVLNSSLGPDALHVAGFEGHEAISELFHFRLDLRISTSTPLPFEKLLGQAATLSCRLPGGGERHFSGILSRLEQDDQDEEFTTCHADLVPRLWLWTQRRQSRIFQQLSVPDTLKAVLEGLDVSFRLAKSYPKREYCVQYAESDFAFVSRLMEDEGIYYFFTHEANGEKMVVTDDTSMLVSLPKAAIYERVSNPNEPRVRAWRKSQQVRSGKYALWDHHFEKWGEPLKPSPVVPPSKVKAGTVDHSLAGHNDGLEIFDGFAGAATRFDTVHRDGGDQPDAIKTMNDAVSRMAEVRMQEETARGIEIHGRGSYANFLPGHVMQLEHHFDADGKYLLTRVEHQATQVGLRSGEQVTFSYENRFWCLPGGLQYRPPRVTPRPTIAGTQTAMVVGPPGSENCLDKFGRVKVQFPWDRHGKKDASASCWLRVAQVWAGKRWGAFFWPRVGHEVVISFTDGDPDRPIIVGSVYNAANMPPFELPANPLAAGIKSCSVGPAADPLTKYNGILFYDSVGNEHVEIHSERANTTQSESGQSVHVGQTYFQIVGGFPVDLGSGSGSGPDSAPQPTLASTLSTGWANHQEFTFGSRGWHTLGLVTENVVGASSNIIINPLGFVAQLGGAGIGAGILAGGLGGLMGEVNLCVGAGTNIHYGPAIDIHRGATIHGGGGKLNPLAIAAGLIVGGLSMAAKVAVAAHWKHAELQLGPAADVARNAAMAVLIGVETAEAWGKDAKDAALHAKILIDDAAKATKDATSMTLDALASEDARQIIKGYVDREIPSLLEQATKEAKRSADEVSEALGEITQFMKTQRELNKLQVHNYDGDFHLTSDNLRFNARRDRTIGHIDIEGRDVRIKTELSTDVDAAQVEVKADNYIELLTKTSCVNISSAPRVALYVQEKDSATVLEMNGRKVEIDTRLLGMNFPTAFLRLEPNSCTLENSLKYGIKVDSTGVTLSAGASKIILTPDGITLSGLKNEFKSELLLELKSMMTKEQSTQKTNKHSIDFITS